MSRSRPSLRARLVLVSVGSGVLIASVAAGVAVWRLDHAEHRAVATALASRIDLARRQLRPDGSLADAAATLDLVQVVGPDGVVRTASPALSGVPALAVPGGETGGRRATAVRTVALSRPDRDLAFSSVAVVLQSRPGSPAGRGLLVVAVDAEPFDNATRQLLVVLVGGLGGVVVAMAGVGWVLIGRALGAVTQLTESADRLPSDEAGAGLPVPRGDVELGRLVTALNRLLGRMTESHKTELAFAAEAGHRLRTPIAALRAEAELGLAETALAATHDSLRRVVDDADRMAATVDQMLTRGRGDAPVSQLVRWSVEQVCRSWRDRPYTRAVEWRVWVDDAIRGTDRAVGLTQTLDPLVENAVRFVEPGGHVSLRARRVEPARLEVVVHNTGPALDPAVAPRLFDAWASGRPDAVAGGLGLWSAREAARRAGGDVVLDPGEVDGVAFRVDLPLL